MTRLDLNIGDKFIYKDVEYVILEKGYITTLGTKRFIKGISTDNNAIAFYEEDKIQRYIN